MPIGKGTYRNCSKGYEQVTSEFKTKKGVLSLPRISRARARGPAAYVSAAPSLKDRAGVQRSDLCIFALAQALGAVPSSAEASVPTTLAYTSQQLHLWHPTRVKILTSAEGLGLDGKGDVDAKLLLSLFKDRDHDLGPVVDGEDNVLDAGLDEGLNLVQAVAVSVCRLILCC